MSKRLMPNFRQRDTYIEISEAVASWLQNCNIKAEPHSWYEVDILQNNSIIAYLHFYEDTVSLVVKPNQYDMIGNRADQYYAISWETHSVYRLADPGFLECLLTELTRIMFPLFHQNQR